MVKPTILAGLFGFLGTLFLGFLYTTLWTWRHSASLGGEDEERVVELENHMKSRLDEELKSLFIQIDGRLDDPENLPPDLDRADDVTNVINQEIGRDDIKPVVEELNQVDTPEELFDEHRESYRTASRDFMWGGFTTLALSGLMAVATIWTGNAFDSFYPFLYLVLAIGILSKGYDGVQNFLEAQSVKDEFEKTWREYKRLD